MSDAPVLKVEADPGDVKLFLDVAARCQKAAQALGDAQNRASLVTLSPNRVNQLVVMLRTGGPVSFNPDETAVLVDLLNLANESAVMLPAHSKTALSVTGLVNDLLDAGNLMEGAARVTINKETVQ